ncbi:MAG: CDP-diacylglycerol--serine O-phosphatidyltransferase [Acidobacteriota bacterium]
MDKRRPSRRAGGRRARRGIFILPSVLTVGNILAGYASIIAAEHGDFKRAAVLLILAAVLDNLDGRVARLTNTTTEFGVQFDSLADLVSFGIAPSFLIYRWGMLPLGRLGWIASFLFVICGAMRLARFNIQRVTDKRYFVGLPIPAAALVVATLVFRHPEPVADATFAIAVLVLVLTLSGLMVSRLRYLAFKSLDAGRGRHSFLAVGLLALILAAIVINPQVVLLVLALVYTISGLTPRRTFAWIFGRRRAAAGRAEGPENDPWAGDVEGRHASRRP